MSIASPPFILGERILLRDVRLTDVDERYYGWMNDPEVTRYLETRFVPQSMAAITDYVAAMQAATDTVFLAIVLRDRDLHIGNIKLGPINWMHRQANIALVIGDRSAWCKGYATESITLLSRYAFQQLGLHKVAAGCYATNEGSARAFLKAGFRLEGRRVKQYFSEGTCVDELLLGRIAPA